MDRDYNSKEWKEVGGGIALMIDLIGAFLLIGGVFLVGQMNKNTQPLVYDVEATKPLADCKEGERCSTLLFSVDFEREDIKGLRFKAWSTLTKDGKNGCSVVTEAIHPEIFGGKNVLSYDTDIADGGSVTLGVAYGRVQLRCDKGLISNSKFTY